MKIMHLQNVSNRKQDGKNVLKVFGLFPRQEIFITRFNLSFPGKKLIYQSS